VLEGARVAALLTATGRAAWQFVAPQASRVSACVVRDRVYAATDNGVLYALGAWDGLPIFRVRSNGSFEGALTVGAGAVVTLGRQDGALWITAVDAATGRPRLTRPVPLRAAGSPLPWRRLIVQAGIADGESVVLGFSRSGKEAFRTSLGGPAACPASPMGAGQLFASLRDGSVTCLGKDGAVAGGPRECGLELDHALAAGAAPRRAGGSRRTRCARSTQDRGAAVRAAADAGPVPRWRWARGWNVHAVDDDGVAACFQLATHRSVVG
jgi:hypothetical protein